MKNDIKMKTTLLNGVSKNYFYSSLSVRATWARYNQMSHHMYFP